MGQEYGKPFALPCAADCPFGKKCSVKYYEEDSCAETITGTIASEVSEFHSELIEEKGKKLGFTTVDPDTWGYVSDGEITVWSRPRI